MHPSNGDGEYSIDPTLSGNPFTVYCDMTTDGGNFKTINAKYTSQRTQKSILTLQWEVVYTFPIAYFCFLMFSFLKHIK